MYDDKETEEKKTTIIIVIAMFCLLVLGYFLFVDIKNNGTDVAGEVIEELTPDLSPIEKVDDYFSNQIRKGEKDLDGMNEQQIEEYFNNLDKKEKK